MQIILASASERRKDLLASLGLKFKIIPSKINEKKLEEKIKDPKKLVLAIALAKAEKIKTKVKAKDLLIISADTFVLQSKISGRKRIMGKPSSREEAEEMLKALSNKAHNVLTGLVCIKGKKIRKILEITKVKFRKLTDKQIKGYLDTGVYLDRAGAYGIQDKKCDFVKEFIGSYTNILGLPLEKLIPILKELGVKTGVKGN